MAAVNRNEEGGARKDDLDAVATGGRSAVGVVRARDRRPLFREAVVVSHESSGFSVRLVVRFVRQLFSIVDKVVLRAEDAVDGSGWVVVLAVRLLLRTVGTESDALIMLVTEGLDGLLLFLEPSGAVAADVLESHFRLEDATNTAALVFLVVLVFSLFETVALVLVVVICSTVGE